MAKRVVPGRNWPEEIAFSGLQLNPFSILESCLDASNVSPNMAFEADVRTAAGEADEERRLFLRFRGILSNRPAYIATTRRLVPPHANATSARRCDPETETRAVVGA
jgi:hypothetical protein